MAMCEALTHPEEAPAPPRFWTSVGVVLMGTATAQGIPLLGSLALTRLFAPSEFGTYSAWLGAVLLAAVAVTGRLEMALALEPDGEPRRRAVVATIVTIALGGLTIALLTAATWMLGFAGRIPGSLLVTGIPTCVLLALTQTWQCWAAAEGRFKDLSSMRITQALAITVVQIIAGLWAPTAQTLAMGYALGVVIGIAFDAARMPLSLRSPDGMAWREAIRVFWTRHRRFPILSLPADTINTAAAQLPLLVISARFGAYIAGLLALTMRALGTPISLLGASVLDVFRRHSAKSLRERGECRADYLRTFKVLAAGSAVTVLVFAIFSEPLFALAFGEEWRTSGTIAKWLLPMFALRFVASPLSYMFYAAGKQHVDLAWQVVLLFVTIATLAVPVRYPDALKAYGLAYCGMYVVYLALSYRFSLGGNHDRHH